VGLKGFERRLERAIEGTFARAFKSGLRPVEVGRRLVREMDDNRSVDVRGRTVVPNSFAVQLSPDDHAQFAEIADTMARELAEAAREHARDEGYSFLGPVGVTIEESASLRAGAFAIDARLKEGKGGAGAGSLILPTGERIPLAEGTITIGRKPESTIVLGDPNASRAHAEIRPHGAGFVMVDLGSTNGSRINGVRVSHQELVDGDELTFGNTRIRFEAS
jgi:FHA domain-containing protein